MKNTCLFYIIIQVLKKKSYIQGITTGYFISCCFTAAFTSEDIIFYSFSELDSELSKNDFCQKFYFNGCTQTPHPLNDQNPLSVMKVFC